MFSPHLNNGSDNNGEFFGSTTNGEEDQVVVMPKCLVISSFCRNVETYNAHKCYVQLLCSKSKAVEHSRFHFGREYAEQKKGNVRANRRKMQVFLATQVYD